MNIEWEDGFTNSIQPDTVTYDVNIFYSETGELVHNESFEGTGLISVILEDLQPFTQYKARVRCGSREHFYKWGDWSNLITFVTKEDIPAAVDVWMQVFNEQTYVVWKKLSAAQSHGTITAYKLVMESSTNGKTEHVTKSPYELCHKVPAGSSKTPRVYSVSAENSAGVSHPSNITIPNLSPGAGVFTRNITGNNGAFELMWELSPKSRCGYVLDWVKSVLWPEVPKPTVSDDFFKKEIPCPGIPNPTYNLPVTPEGDNDLTLGYMPQNGSN
ncbi:leukemia inhibitory factor receptor alpha b isoform X1 [Silurus meridionalis]|nr:leukemia inhibitory factor receptor alpha b isoform X1 [Silurus meridionalis]